jgi:hypothetical protein
VAPQIILTCAHVLQRTPRTIIVRWAGRDLPAKVVVRDPEPSTTRGDFYPPPDIGLVAVISPVDHPSLYIESAAVTPRSFLEIWGFSPATPTGVAEDPVTVEVIAQTSSYIKFKAARVIRGMSGSPAIDEHGSVRGMLKSASDDPAGGWLVTAEDLAGAIRKHRAAIRIGALSSAPLIRPEAESWLHRMLTAQREIAKQYPYRIGRLSRRPTPPLTAVYVEQGTERRESEREIQRNRKRITEQNEPEVISSIEMLRRHRHCIVLGGPGGGKSTMTQQLVAESARWWLGEGSALQERTPATGLDVTVRVPATALIARRPIFESLAIAVTEELGGQQKLRLEPEVFARPPVAGAQWLILVDGLDEVLDERHEELVHTLGSRIAAYGEPARYVITSRRLRPLEFAKLRVGLVGRDSSHRFGEYLLRPFEWEAVSKFAVNWFRPEGAEPSELSPEEFLASASNAGLRPLLRIPLLATIAAVVFEENGGEPLPHDRTGLYAKFVEVLLTARKQQTQTLTMLREQVSGLGRSALDFMEFLFDERYDCLVHLASARMNSDSRPSRELVMEWLRLKNRGSLPAGIGLGQIREVLLSTGLIELQGDELVFIHFSFAEYLAGERFAAGFRPEAWLDRSARREPDSFALFTLGHWVRAGNDPTPLVAEMLRSSDKQGPRALENVATVIDDGGAVLPGQDTVAELVEETVRRTAQLRQPIGSKASPRRMIRHISLPGGTHPLRARAVGKVLSAVVQRVSSRAAVIRLARDSSVALADRVEAAKALVAHGSESDRADGMRVLIQLAYQTWLSPEDRLVPLCAIAEVGGPRERPHAVQRMAMTVETASNEAVRARALILMAGINEFPAAAMALVRRGLDQRKTVAERARALDSLGVLMGNLPDEEQVWPVAGPYAEAVEFSNAAWTHPARQSSAPHSMERSGVDFASTVVWTMQLVAQLDPVGLDATLRGVMHDRSFRWIERMEFAGAVRRAGYPDVADRAIRELARDRDLTALARVTALTQLRDEQAKLRCVDDLLEWANDPGERMDLRRAAITTLAGTSSMEWRFWQDYVADRGVPSSLRLAAVVALGWVQQEREGLLNMLRTLRREHLPGSPAWLATRLATLGLVLRTSRRLS